MHLPCNVYFTRISPSNLRIPLISTIKFELDCSLVSTVLSSIFITLIFYSFCYNSVWVQSALSDIHTLPSTYTKHRASYTYRYCKPRTRCFPSISSILLLLRFEVFRAAKVQIAVFCVLTPCGIGDRYGRFGGTYRLCLVHGAPQYEFWALNKMFSMRQFHQVGPGMSRIREAAVIDTTTLDTTKVKWLLVTWKSCQVSCVKIYRGRGGTHTDTRAWW